MLQLSGEYQAKEIPQAIQYLKNNFAARQHFWYGHYYAAHSMHQVAGKDWEEWYAKICNLLLSRQSGDGNWNVRDLDRESVGPIYQSSIAVIILSVPTWYLPIFQR